MTKIVRVDEIYVVENEYSKSHGANHLDEIGKESFINHIHIEGENRRGEAENIISNWQKQMKENWPGVKFRIYVNENDDEIILRFHAERVGIPNWSELSDKYNRIIGVA